MNDDLVEEYIVTFHQYNRFLHQPSCGDGLWRISHIGKHKGVFIQVNKKSKSPLFIGYRTLCAPLNRYAAIGQ